AKAAIAVSVNGIQKDLCDPIVEDSKVSIITIDSDEGLEIMRHTLTAQVLARAVKNLYPNAKLAIGPTINDGFYYDFEFVESISPDDLEKIEKEMHKIAKQNLNLSRGVMDRTSMQNHFKSIGENYKVEIINDIPESEELSFYKQDTFLDLCRGPHVPNTKFLRFFKLMKISGAYWRGDSKNQMLQRIYGTAWLSKEDLDDYLLKIEEAEKRDHRKIGAFQNLFHFREESPGMIFWHPKGYKIWQIIENYMRNIYKNNGYQEIKCPQILDINLWKQSGHWDNFSENMFVTGDDEKQFALKPMNCPGHVQVYKSELRSYKDLPIRYGEFGSCHRNEPSGALHGTFRVRGFTQDDGHIFCTKNQIEKEVLKFHSQAIKVYEKFSFNEIDIKIGLRPEKRLGDDKLWDSSENALRNALQKSDITWEELPGEGAFYGPKIEYHLKDSIGRSWQCGTIQVDFMMPQRLGANYISADNTKEHPVMLHRAILGSLERFIGILIENHSGALPFWLSPFQISILTITDDQVSYAQELDEIFKKNNIRVNLDLRNEKISYKIRQHVMQKIPYICVLGNNEVSNRTLSVRFRGEDKSKTYTIEDFLSFLSTL
ncbi:MAG: threonine--tRNA ligase, partial [Hyphomicrobiales bacterium]